MSNFKKKFGENLKALRKSRKITQEKLAELIDIHFRQMSKIETGDNFPSSKTIEKLCCALQISPATLFDFDFVYEGEVLMNGTENSTFYRAIKQDNVVVFEDYRGKRIISENTLVSDSDKRLLKMAKKLSKPITVEYFEDNKRTKVLIYNPDGSINTLDGKNEYMPQEVEDLTKLFKTMAKHQDYVDFIKLAIQSIEDDAALERLESMINGIKMVRRQIQK